MFTLRKRACAHSCTLGTRMHTHTFTSSPRGALRQVDEAQLSEVLREMYCSTGLSDASKEWNAFREAVLDELLKVKLSHHNVSIRSIKDLFLCCWLASVLSLLSACAS